MSIFSTILSAASKIANETGQEIFVLPFILIALLAHWWGTKANRRIIKRWVEIYGPVLQGEYAVLGFKSHKSPSVEEVEEDGLLKAMMAQNSLLSDDIMQEKSGQEYITYATGRQNVAFTDIKISLFKRYNPFSLLFEYLGSTLLESISTPVERMEVTSYPFDGKETEIVPNRGGNQGQEPTEQQQQRKSSPSSSYDDFVWAVVHKDGMQHLRDDRYDISLTSTKDHPKLPGWATVMSESAEVTEALLTPELIEAVKEAGDLFEHLIITDQPLDQPKKLSDAVPQKRLYLSLRLPSGLSKAPLQIFKYFLRLPDQLVEKAHFRPEVLRKVRQPREERINKLKKAEEGEKADERASKREKEKKEKRDVTLRGLTADDQRRYLEREREREIRKGMKKMTHRA
ncbi:MAG: hypothetical protein M1816_002665 [Peltula sp. TS41687]|nr:MAG: hypothetical protein M1816_002665 [Peltula sp. TS41687]